MLCLVCSTTIVTGDCWNGSVLNSDILDLAEFFTARCGPCRMVDRVIEKFAQEYDGRVKCFLVNAGHDRELADEYGIKAVLVVFLFKNGEKHATLVGTQHKETYVAAIEKLLAL